MKETFLNLILNGKITGFNLFNEKYPLINEKCISYGHADYDHLHLLLKELNEDDLLDSYQILRRNSIYLWNDEWIPSSNTAISLVQDKKIAIEAGYLINFFPQNGIEKSLISFLIHRCFNNGNDCIKKSWEVPYIAIRNISHPEFIPTRETTIPNDKGITQSCFVPDSFKTKLSKATIVSLFKPFAEYIRNS